MQLNNVLLPYILTYEFEIRLKLHFFYFNFAKVSCSIMVSKLIVIVITFSIDNIERSVNFFSLTVERKYVFSVFSLRKLDSHVLTVVMVMLNKVVKLTNIL